MSEVTPAKQVLTRGKGKFVFDGECFPNFTSFIFKNIITGEKFKFIIFSDREKPARSINQLIKLVQFIEHECSWLIGYNSINYDNMLLMYLVMHYVRLRNSTIQAINSELYELSTNIIEFGKIRKTPPECYALRKIQPKFQSLDLFLIYNPTERTSLKQLAISLKWPVLEDLPFKPTHIVLFHEINKIEHYNNNDVDITEKVMYHLTDKINRKN